jgi:hypothetical protein
MHDVELVLASRQRVKLPEPVVDAGAVIINISNHADADGVALVDLSAQRVAATSDSSRSSPSQGRAREDP